MGDEENLRAARRGDARRKCCPVRKNGYSFSNVPDAHAHFPAERMVRGVEEVGKSERERERERERMEERSERDTERGGGEREKEGRAKRVAVDIEEGGGAVGVKKG